MSATRSGVEDAPGIERFADAVLPGAFRPDEQGADVEPREPLPDDLGTEVGAIVGPEVGRAAPRGEQLGQGRQRIIRGQLSSLHDRQKLPGALVQDGEQSESAPVVGAVRELGERFHFQAEGTSL